jgi:hypothetical protein
MEINRVETTIPLEVLEEVERLAAMDLPMPEIARLTGLEYETVERILYPEEPVD